MELHILGTRGVPANHGGFETFAENLSLYMVGRGHKVIVYCQLEPDEQPFSDIWQGVHRIGFSEKNNPLGTILFDLRSALTATKHSDAVILTLGYNTAIFSLIHRFRGVRHFMNMDGIEWKRQKWGLPQKAWLLLNEWCGAKLANHVIADHPNIKLRLQTKVSADKISVIPYGADPVDEQPEDAVRKLGLEPGKYCLVVARPEPENSILEIVTAYLQRLRSYRLVILGRYRSEDSAYQAEILALSKHPDVVMLGAIHDKAVVRALRYHALAYVHGHQVGGTNPSLVESMAAGNPVLAQDNPFNRWVAGPEAKYFKSPEELSSHFDTLAGDTDTLEAMQVASRSRRELLFRQESILSAYEQLLMGQPLQEGAWTAAPILSAK